MASSSNWCSFARRTTSIRTTRRATGRTGSPSSASSGTRARNDNSLDLALFVNGIPWATAELKNSATGQTVRHAVKQYERDRSPKEPLFAFGRTLAHFAVGNEEVKYTTRLRGAKTYFLPFDKGTADGGRGNPPNPDGHATHYLWEDVWAPDTVLDLLQNYLHLQTSTEKVWDAKKARS